MSSQTEQGLGVIDLNNPNGPNSPNSPNVSAKWVDELTPQHDYYMSLNRLDNPNNPNNNPDTFSFVSLAPSLSDPARDLDIVQWSYSDPSQIKVLASLGNNNHNNNNNNNPN